MNIYQEHILDHAQYPRHWGRVDPADAVARVENPLCGDWIEVSVRIDDGRVGKIGVAGEGCMISKAAGSILAEHVHGRSVKDAKKMTIEDMRALLGIELTISRVRCGLLAFESLKKAL
ncbi:MAG: iron-sulfur cluster assembly scaffold protein [bacterium]|nr:iron-sulfur cluster assembly scaffold protein [bacterium]